MKHETLWFRMAVAALVIGGLLILVLSLHGRHRPPPDDTTLPSVVGPAPQLPSR